MRRYFWSALILLLASSAVTFLAAMYRNRLASHGQLVALGDGPVRPGKVQPLVMIPPPAFLTDPLELIETLPEPPESASASWGDSLPPPPLPLSSKTPLRMPYADEDPEPRADLREPNPLVPPVCPCENEESEVWQALLEFVRQILPVAHPVEEPADPASESPAPETAPQSGTDDANLPSMPPAMDYHHVYPSCPYLNGCPRSCPPFPGPAYQFDRPMPTSDAPTK